MTRKTVEKKHVIAPLISGFLCLLLIGCETDQQRSARVLFDGINFRTKAKSESKDRMSFAVTVPKPDRNLQAALAAGSFEATTYCVQNFGTSDLEWFNVPDVDDAALQYKGSRLLLTGRCVLW